jgi:rhamnulokinase
MTTAAVAIDLGAESGRVIVGVLADGRLRLEELHRFVHEPVWLPTGLHWNTTGIWREIVAGLRRAAAWAQANHVELSSVGVDTWGVDWALVDAAGELVGLPHAYRDPRNTAAHDEVVARLGADRIYQTTGIQFMVLNTLYSLYAQQLSDPGMLEAAERLLFTPDLMHYWLSGRQAVEATIASTSQMINCHTGQWACDMLDEVGLPTRLLAPTVPPGTVIGTLRSALAAETGLPESMRVVAPGSHDTASAVAAVPAVGTVPFSRESGAAPQQGARREKGTVPLSADWCYLSSGTWSLLGAELPGPCVTPAAQEAMFTNELGVCGTTRFLKNIPGLWLVQECRRDLARQGQDFDYPELARLAGQARPFATLVDPSHQSFQTPGGMLEKMAAVIRPTGQPVPASPGQFVRCALESLALAYREKSGMLESILGRRFDVVHIVGGGGKNTLLSQMTADATGRRVIVGPYEATAMGNALVQMMAIGAVADLPELRRIVARSTDLVTYEPADTAAWDAAYERYQGLA